jgi:hypothetical protein
MKLDLRDMRSLNTTHDGVFASGCLYHVTKAEFTVCLRDINVLLNRNGVLCLNPKEGQGEGFPLTPLSEVLLDVRSHVSLHDFKNRGIGLQDFPSYHEQCKAASSGRIHLRGKTLIGIQQKPNKKSNWAG